MEKKGVVRTFNLGKMYFYYIKCCKSRFRTKGYDLRHIPRRDGWVGVLVVVEIHK